MTSFLPERPLSPSGPPISNAPANQRRRRRSRYTFTSRGGHLVKKISFTYWKDGKFYIGFLNQVPDYQTQATTKSELTENLKDLLKDIESREVPFIRKVEELLVA